jgi:predicted TIM-barrel fold metal-dependent hydrolase
LPGTLIDTHPHLFASLPVFVPRSQIEQMARVANAVEQVVQTRVFRAVALGWAPEIAQFDPGVRGEISDHSHSIVAGTFKCLTSAAFY